MIEAIIYQLWPYVVAIISGLVAYLGIRQSGKSAGRAEAEREQQKAAAVAREKAREVDNEIDSLDDDTVRDRAKRWVRGSDK